MFENVEKGWGELKIIHPQILSNDKGLVVQQASSIWIRFVINLTPYLIAPHPKTFPNVLQIQNFRADLGVPQ